MTPSSSVFNKLGPDLLKIELYFINHLVSYFFEDFYFVFFELSF